MMAKGESQDSEKDLLADVEFPPGEAQKDKQTDVQAIPKAASNEQDYKLRTEESMYRGQEIPWKNQLAPPTEETLPPDMYGE